MSHPDPLREYEEEEYAWPMMEDVPTSLALYSCSLCSCDPSEEPT